VDHSFKIADLLKSMRYECLTAKARIYAHDQHHIQVMKDIAQQAYGRMGVQRYGGLHAQLFYLLDIPVQMAAGLQVNGEPVRPCFPEGFREFLRLLYHKVNVTDLGGCFADLLDHRKAKADIGHKPPIHYVQVKPVGLAFIQHFTFFFQAEKIGG
jgi:hypothetical protein